MVHPSLHTCGDWSLCKSVRVRRVLRLAWLAAMACAHDSARMKILLIPFEASTERIPSDAAKSGSGQKEVKKRREPTGRPRWMQSSGRKGAPTNELAPPHTAAAMAPTVGGTVIHVPLVSHASFTMMSAGMSGLIGGSRKEKRPHGPRRDRNTATHTATRVNACRPHISQKPIT